jgi:AraC-like DNA-binding protein
MQERINHFLNHQFPIFQWTEKGRFYYFIMILFFVGLANVTQPFGIVNWVEYHRSLVLTCYIFLFFGMYPMLHYVLRSLKSRYFSARIWTRKKEFRVFLFFFPTIMGLSCLYAYFTVPGFKLTPVIFEDILLYNCTLSFMSIPTFGFYVDKKLIPARPIQLFVDTQAVVQKKPVEPVKSVERLQNTKLTPRTQPKESGKSRSCLTEEQALKILQKLTELMETEQLYLSKKCKLEYVATNSGIPQHRISEAINNFSDKNFSDFINEYRCKHACRLLENNVSQLLTIEAIGEKCGFQNRVSFHKAFKKIYGISPSEYQEKENFNKL